MLRRRHGCGCCWLGEALEAASADALSWGGATRCLSCLQSDLCQQLSASVSSRRWELVMVGRAGSGRDSWCGQQKICWLAWQTWEASRQRKGIRIPQYSLLPPRPWAVPASLLPHRPVAVHLHVPLRRCPVRSTSALPPSLPAVLSLHSWPCPVLTSRGLHPFVGLRAGCLHLCHRALRCSPSKHSQTSICSAFAILKSAAPLRLSG